METNIFLLKKIAYNQKFTNDLSELELLNLEKEIYGLGTDKEKIVYELENLLSIMGNRGSAEFFLSEDFNELTIEDKKIMLLLFEIYYNVDFGFYSCINKIQEKHLTFLEKMIEKYNITTNEKKRGL